MSKKNNSGNQFGYGYSANRNPYEGYSANYSNDFVPNNMQYNAPNNMQNNMQYNAPNNMQNNAPQDGFVRNVSAVDNQYGHQYEQPYVRNGRAYETPVPGPRQNYYTYTDNSPKVLQGVGIVLGFIGFIFVVVACLVGYFSAQFFNNADEVTAVIADIDTHKDHDGDTSHTVYVDYYYNGEYYYHVKINSYSSSWYIGKEIKAYVDPDHPYKIKTKMGTIILVCVFGGLGTAMLISSSACLIAAAKKKRKK